MSAPETAPTSSTLNKERHIKYWLRCLKTYLPAEYTSNDSNRMTLAFFTLSALDLLSALETHTTPSERTNYVNFIYSCQHPEGGFRGFNGTDLGEEKRTPQNSAWDPASLPGTFFALSALLVLGDPLERVDRRACLTWVRRLQSHDGSFGDALNETGNPESTRDVRFSFLAACVRWILRTENETEIEDVDLDLLCNFVMASQNYDGGIAKAPYHESHAGWTYCGIGTLALVDRVTTPGQRESKFEEQRFVKNLLNWLVSRQTCILDYESDEEGDEESLSLEADGTVESNAKLAFTASRHSHTTPRETLEPIKVDTDGLKWAGFNGRCNKPADTCYSWWVSGSLAIMDKIDLFDHRANRSYLLEKTQHIVGGFGKLPGDRPDILHSYLGLAALSAIHEPGVKAIDPTLCISVERREYLESLPWRQRIKSSNP